MKTHRTKKRRITKAVSMDSELARWSERKAVEQNRSWSNFVETLLERRRQEEAEREAVTA